MDVRALRESLGVSQGDLAEKMGVSQTTLSRIENGMRDPTQGEETLIRAVLPQPVVPIIEEPIDEPPPPDLPRLASYPAAPTSVQARRAWLFARNVALQATRLPSPRTGTFGGLPKVKKG